MVAWLWVKCEIILYPQLYCMVMGYQWYDMVYILSLSRDMVFMVYIFYLLERYPSETDQPGTGGGPYLNNDDFCDDQR
jgi:hypothetical protein